MLKNIKKQLNFIYLNNDEYTHMERAIGGTDLLDTAFISPNLAKHDIHFQYVTTWAAITYPLKSQLMLQHIETQLLTTSSTNLTRMTEEYSNQHSRQR